MNQASGCVKGQPGYSWNVQAVTPADNAMIYKVAPTYAGECTTAAAAVSH